MIETFQLIEQELNLLEINLKKLVKSEHAILDVAAEHLFNAGGKRLRPAIVFLVAKATKKEKSIKFFHRRLAEITEIIHTASLVHDDVVDECSVRRGVKTVHTSFSVPIAVLAGDFLFGQSSWYLANLNNLEVVKIISKVITDFAEGEIRQGIYKFNLYLSVDEYIEKSFLKTASLIASSCKGSVMLTETNYHIANNLYNYGKYLGLAFQIIDDILDLISNAEVIGKPIGSDFKNGNLTAPILFSLSNMNLVNLLYKLKKKEVINLNNLNLQIINQSGGIEKAVDLAFEYVYASIKCLNCLQDSEYKKSLITLCNSVLNKIRY
jgi:all-trans-nonaprenyl-diphosphate synthase